MVAPKPSLPMKNMQTKKRDTFSSKRSIRAASLPFHNMHANSEINFERSKFIQNIDNKTKYSIAEVIGSGTFGDILKGSN